MHTDLYRGFISSPLEIMIALYILIGIVLFFLITSIVRSQKSKREMRKRAAATYQKLLKQFTCSEAETDALDKLGCYLKKPERRYTLMQSQAIFDACAEKAKKDNLLPHQMIAALRVKLGYGAKNTGRRPESSTELPPGASVSVLTPHHHTLHGKILDPTPDSFRVAIAGDGFSGHIPALPPHTAVRIMYHDRTGLYEFDTKLQKQLNATIQLNHSETLRRVQRRAYYRKKTNLPVFIHHPGSMDSAVQTNLIDIGGGGASLYNRSNLFAAGEDIALSFHPNSTHSLDVIGKILRTSKDNTILHVDLRHLKETTRDKIYRVLFQ